MKKLLTFILLLTSVTGFSQSITISERGGELWYRVGNGAAKPFSSTTAASIAAKQPIITGASNLTTNTVAIAGTVADADSSTNAITSAWAKRNIPRFLTADSTQFAYTNNRLTLKSGGIRSMFSVTGTGATYNSTTGVFSFTGGGGSSNVYSTTDAQNSSQTALYMAPNADQQRVFFGATGKTIYAINFVNVSGFENVPGFKLNVGNLGLGLDADATITRAGNVVKLNSSSTGTGTDNGYDFYGSSTSYATFASGQATLLMSLRTLGGGRLGIGQASPTAKLHITGSTGYNQLRLETSYTPTGTADANGNVGDFAWDSGFIYIKTSAGWKRSTLSTF